MAVPVEPEVNAIKAIRLPVTLGSGSDDSWARSISATSMRRAPAWPTMFSCRPSGRFGSSGTRARPPGGAGSLDGDRTGLVGRDGGDRASYGVHPVQKLVEGDGSVVGNDRRGARRGVRDLAQPSEQRVPGVRSTEWGQCGVGARIEAVDRHDPPVQLPADHSDFQVKTVIGSVLHATR